MKKKLACASASCTPTPPSPRHTFRNVLFLVPLQRKCTRHSRILHTNHSITKDKAAQQQALEKVHKYEEAFSRIQQATGAYFLS